jgi:putative thioredoxin
MSGMNTLFNNEAAGAAPAADPVMDVTQANFMAEVVDASAKFPVLVDFWATWCGPCKTLTPTLEKVVRAQGGRVRLAKIDVDKNRELVAQLSRMGLPMQSVPTVVAFWQGQIADTFSGALPESEVKRFVEALLKLAGSAPPAADYIAQGKELLEAGEAESAAQYFAAAVQEDQDKPEAWGGFIRAVLAMGDEDQATQLLAQVPPKLAEHPEVAGARSALALAEEGRKAQGALAGLEARLAANPDDFEARYELATALNASGARAEAAAALLEIIRRDRAWNEGAARLQLLKFFEAWGMDDPATMAARRKLSSLLFS